MMQLYAPPNSVADTLSDERDSKLAQDTPTVRAKVTPSKEMFRDPADPEVAELVRVCKSCMESGPDGATFCPKCGDELVAIRRMPDMYLNEKVGGKYRIAEKIGQGGMGVVYLAVNDDLGQKVAVKFLSKKFADDESIVLRFLNEAKSYCRVSHPNAVTLLEYGQHDDGALYIITEFIDGKNVTETLKDRGPLPAETVLDVAIQIAEVLSVAHSGGVIHRDLKPDNIMLIPSARGRLAVKVLDFGIAKIIDDDHGPTTETGSVFGTPEFMSPEQARGDNADGRSDIYALGIILFYMLTGKLPFHGKNKLVVLNMQLNEDPPRPSSFLDEGGVPPKLEAVVMKCLNKKRTGRYQSADDLLEALEELRVPGGAATDRVGKSKNPEVIIAKSETIRFGDMESEVDEADGHADTLAAPIDHSHRLAELESIEMWREQSIDTSNITASTDRNPPIAGIAAVATVAVALIAGGFWYAGSGGRDARLNGVMLTGQVSGLLTAAQLAVEEGSIDQARSTLDESAKLAADSELPPDASARRAEIRSSLAALAKLQKQFDSAMAASDCWAANDVVGKVRVESKGLATKLESRVAECRKKVTTKTDPPQLPPASSQEPTQAPKPAPAVNAPTNPEPVEKPPAEVKPAHKPKPVETQTKPPVDVEPDPPADLAPENQEQETKNQEPKTSDEEKSSDEERPPVPDGMALPPKHIE